MTIPKFLNAISAWLPPLALMAFIFFMSTQQNISVSDNVQEDFAIFKSLHILEYSLLTILLFRALFKTTTLTFTNMIRAVAILALLYGISDEIHQTFVPTRTGKLRDVFIDGIGISVTSYLIMRYKPTVKKLLSSTFP